MAGFLLNSWALEWRICQTLLRENSKWAETRHVPDRHSTQQTQEQVRKAENSGLRKLHGAALGSQTLGSKWTPCPRPSLQPAWAARRLFQNKPMATRADDTAPQLNVYLAVWGPKPRPETRMAIHRVRSGSSPSKDWLQYDPRPISGQTSLSFLR